jgi:hypothetical protein
MNAEINSRLAGSLGQGWAGLLVELKEEGLQRRIAEVVIDYVNSHGDTPLPLKVAATEEKEGEE